MMVTCTGGERGSILNPAMDKPGVRRDGEIRREEMAEAARILGVEHRWLGYVDSGLPEGDPKPPLPDGCFAVVPVEERRRSWSSSSASSARMCWSPTTRTAATRTRTTSGATRSRWPRSTPPATRSGTLSAGEPWQPLKMYYTHGFSKARMQRSTKHCWPGAWNRRTRSGWQAVGRQAGRHHGPGHHQGECADYFEVRDQALLAHATQIDPTSRWFALDLDLSGRPGRTRSTNSPGRWWTPRCPRTTCSPGHGEGDGMRSAHAADGTDTGERRSSSSPGRGFRHGEQPARPPRPQRPGVRLASDARFVVLVLFFIAVCSWRPWPST